ncbi:MAG: GntR family transcriptional regulator [Verrucomicrobia bacterium]|nr:GntR family transcriptional regulator [Verrucomicrobiota bacterium]
MPKSLHYQIDAHSGVPVYRQIMDQTKYYAASGALAAGEQLPSIRELARQLCVNPTTVVKAYTELEHEAVIEMRHGRGVFVAAAPAPMSEREQTKALRRLARQLAVEAAQMNAPAELVWRIVGEQLEAVSDDGRDGRTWLSAVGERKPSHG